MAENSKKPCMGLDFGGAYLKLAVTDKKGVTRLVIEPLPDGIVKDGDVVAPDTALIFLRDVLKRNRIKAKECAFILPSGRTVFRQITTPVMDDRQIRKNLPFEFRDVVTGKKENYYFDYAIGSLQKNDHGEVTGLNLMITAILKTVMENYIHFFKKAGMKLLVAAPRESAFSNLVRSYEESHPEIPENEDYCFLDMGHSATRIHIYSGPFFKASRIIEYGGAMVETAIARDLDVDLAAARTYKESSQEATRFLAETSTAYSSIALEIRKAISFYNSTSDRQIERIFSTGGGCRMTPLIDTISETVGLEIHDIVEMLPPIVSDREQADICASAIGITLQ